MTIVLPLALISAALFPILVSASSQVNRYIVELDPAASSQGEKSLNVHADFYQALQKHTSFDVFREYNVTDVFVGASVTLKSSADVAAIAKIPGVKPVRVVIPSHPRDPVVPPDSESTLKMTGVDKVHAMGIFGKGVKIGIIDTGVDYTHPSLGGGFGPGHKIAGGFDFVGDAYNGSNTPMPDPDPLDQCNGHGTHVAGIIGANPGNEFNITGIAYESTIFAYRVFGCDGAGGDDVLIEAMLQAHRDGMDVVNLSLGTLDNWTESMVAVVLHRLIKTGIIAAVASGNDGSVGAFAPSDPANTLGAISAASVDNVVFYVQNATTSDPTHPTISYLSIFPLPFNGSLPIYATSNDTTVIDDACNPLPDDTPDLSKFLVITQKLQNIANKGGDFSFVYDNGAGFSAIATDNFTHTSLISENDGVFLVQQFIAGKNITVSFPQTGGGATIDSPTGGLVSTFTSYGPTNDLFFKPAVSTPGGNVLSTFPVNNGSFAVLSGTSMATPHAAGCAALLLQAKGKSLAIAQSALTLFETTAQVVSSSHTDGDPLQTAAQQGAGLLNIFSALTYKTRLSPGELLLNDTNHFVGEHVITITNTGHTVETYNVTHIPAGTAIAFEPDDIFPLPGPVALTKDYATVEIKPKVLTIPPSGEAKVTVTIQPPKGLDAATFPIYSGFIQVQGRHSGEKLHASYLGLNARARDLKIIDNTDSILGIELPSLVDVSSNPITDSKNYTFQGDDYPTLIFRLANGSPKVKVDLVESNFTLPSGNVKGVRTLGNLTDFNYISRSILTDEQDLDGTYSLNLTHPLFGDNSTISNGQYRFFLRALKVSGDRNNEADYETFLSPIVGVDVPGQ
ncbi:hypothetical protein Clacol_010179 [Clathrus columnatus]|uniref:Uncharacterized protein n=1 Tax=Clathrus columnatus TaxID=1419009 RepID=A0AAV5AMM6_9AGAM|nr:hypothetical protein Clacol_010179 [Clathrus columnatus]